MRRKRKDFVRLQEFVWMYGVVAAFGFIGMLIFVVMCIGGVYES